MRRKAKAPVIDSEEKIQQDVAKHRRLFNRTLKSPCLICKTNEIPKCVKGCKTLECFQLALRKVPIYQRAVNTEDNSYEILYEEDN